MLFDENDDNGYQPSPHIARLLEGGQDDEATVRAFIADIFAQRIASHHRDTIESSKWADTLPQFIERAPRIIEVIVIKDGAKDFSIRQVQQITDDLVRLDDTGFVRRYGLEELFAALADAEAAWAVGDWSNQAMRGAFGANYALALGHNGRFGEAEGILERTERILRPDQDLPLRQVRAARFVLAALAGNTEAWDALASAGAPEAEVDVLGGIARAAWSRIGDDTRAQQARELLENA